MAVVFLSLTGYIRILIPDKEWDLLGAHFGFEKESLKGLNDKCNLLAIYTCESAIVLRTFVT